MTDNLPEAVREYREFIPHRSGTIEIDYNIEPIDVVIKADAAIDALLEERKRLEVCGTCGEYGDFGEDTNCGVSAAHIPNPYHAYRPPVVCEPSDACHFSPSKWTPYWKEGE